MQIQGGLHRRRCRHDPSYRQQWCFRYRPTWISDHGHSVRAQEYQHKESQWSRWHSMLGAERSSGRNCPISAIYIQSIINNRSSPRWLEMCQCDPLKKTVRKKPATTDQYLLLLCPARSWSTLSLIILWVTWTRIMYLSTTSMDFARATHVKEITTPIPWWDIR